MSAVAFPDNDVESGRRVSFSLYTRTIPALLLAALLALVAGFRWLGDGYDFFPYYLFYNNIPGFFDLGNSRFEIGYQATAWFFRVVLNQEYEVFGTVLVFVALVIKFRLFMRHMAHPWLAIVLYLAMFYSVHEYTQVRSAVAISFGYWAIHLWLGERRLYALAAFAVAGVFHYSIFALGVVFLLSAYLTSRFRLLVPFGLAFVFALSVDIRNLFSDFAGSLNPLVESYAYGNQFYFEQNIFSLLNIALTMIALYSICTGIFSRSVYNARFTILVLVGMIAVLVFVSSPVLSSRIRDMFIVAAIFLACRERIGIRELPVVGALALAGLWQVLSALDQGLITI